MEYAVFAMEAFGSSLFLGGGFETAGGAPSSFFAQWDPVVRETAVAVRSSLPQRPTLSVQMLRNPVRDGLIRFSIDVPGGGSASCALYDVQGRAQWRSATQAGVVQVAPRGPNGALTPGVYYLVVEADGERRTRSVVLVR